MNIKFYFKRHRNIIVLYFFILILQSIFGSLGAIFGANFLSTLIDLSYNVAFNYLIITSLSLLLYFTCLWITTNMYSKYSNIIWSEIARDLTKRGFSLKSSTFSDNNSGGFIQRIMDDPMNAIEEINEIPLAIVEILMNLIVVAYILSLNWILGLLYLGVLLILFLLEIRRQKVLEKNSKKTKEVRDRTYSVVGEIIQSEKDIKSLGIEKELDEISLKNFGEFKHFNKKEKITDNNFWNLRNILLNLFTCLIFFLGLYLAKNECLVISTLVLVYTYKDNMYSLIWFVGNMSKNITQAKISLERMFNLYNEKLYASEKFGDVELANIKGSIEFKNVRYAYDDIEEFEKVNKKGKKIYETKKIKKDPVFKNLSFKINPNTTVAFVGKSGCGKSTIMDLTAKLIEVDDGEVLIDGHNINDLTKKTLRENISMINQFPYIFDMSIKENLLLIKPEATDEELWEVLEKSGFDIDIKKMKKGLNTKVGASGIKLSGGQRQRLAIARTLLKKSKILIFDESTSSLDNFAQSHIQKTIDSLKGQHTIIIVAHRLSTIKNVDKIYFLKDGEIFDEGNFDYLYNNNEEFKKMFLVENISEN